MHVFSFPNDCERLSTMETRDNPNGLAQVASDSHCELLVFPGRAAGSAQLVVRLLYSALRTYNCLFSILSRPSSF